MGFWLRTSRPLAAFAAGAAMMAGGPALAADAAAAQEPQSIWQWEHLTGNWGGERDALHEQGLDFTLNYIGESFSNLSGGLERKSTYEGQLNFSVDADLEKLFGWTGGKAHVTIYQIHDVNDRNAADLTGSLGDPSSIDAMPTTRLFTLWLQQDLPHGGSIRVGQLAADEDFATADTAGGLLNGGFGWPVLNAANLPSGGPAYPLATPGALVTAAPTDRLALLFGIFSGDPAGPHCDDDPQICNRHGLEFSTSGGALLMSEAQFSIGATGDDKNKDGGTVVKLGGWYHTGSFDDQRFGEVAGTRVSLADDPDADPIGHRGDWGIYGLVDTTVPLGGDRSMSAFIRGSAAPSDRNLVSWEVDAGIGFKGVLPNRADDVLTFGVAYTHIGRDASALDRDTRDADPGYPIRDYETVLEVSYIAQIAPWWSIQPDVQYIIHPGGNVPRSDDDERATPDAFLVGVRTSLTF